jgi:hypothetical protein
MGISFYHEFASGEGGASIDVGGGLDGYEVFSEVLAAKGFTDE